MSSAAPPPIDIPRAALWMIGAIVSFSTMAVAGREASVDLDTFELMTYRSMVGMVIVLVVARLAGTLREVQRTRLGEHGLRNICHFTGQNLWFWAVTMIPLAQVFALEFTTPLWVIGLAALFLGEKLTRIKVLAGIMGFVGILIVVRPGTAPVSAGMVAAAASSICFAATAIFTKRLTSDQSITQILFWLTVMQLGLGLICCLIDGDMAVPRGASILWVVVIGICGLTAHFCLTTALRLAPASVVMPLDFIRLPAIALVGMVFYAEPLMWGVFVGGAIIFAANYLNTRDAHRRSLSKART